MQKKIYLLFLLCIACLPMVFSADIIGYGGEDIFGNDQHNINFKTNINNSALLVNNSAEVLAGSERRAIACDIDTSTTENELLIAQGGSIRMYSGKGGILQLIDTYSTGGTIDHFACLNDEIYYSLQSGGLSAISYSGSGFLLLNITDSSNVVSDISCNYEVGYCLSVYNNTNLIHIFNNDVVSIIDIEPLIDLSFTPDVNDDIQLVSFDGGVDYAFYAYDASEQKMHTVRVVDGEYSETIRIGYGRIGYGDYYGDGSLGWCTTRINNNIEGNIYCYDLDDDLIDSLELTFDGSGSPHVFGYFVGDGSIDGVDEYYVSVDIIPGQRLLRFSPLSGTDTFFSGVDQQFSNQQKSIFSYFGLDIFYIAANKQLFLFNNYDSVVLDVSSSFDTTPYFSGADISGDNIIDIIVSDTGKTQVYFSEEVDPAEANTITFASNVIDGGFFGYYEGDTCPDTNVTFRAQECIGDLETCNYYNAIAEDERLVTDCGTGTVTTGSYSPSSPQVTCEYVSEGDYDVVLYIQGESTELNTTSNSNTPIRVSVDDSVGCNGVTYEVPRQTNETTEDSGESETGEDGAGDDTDPDTDTTTGSELFDNFVTHIFLIVGILIILAFPITLMYAGIKDPFILLLGTTLGALFVSILNLISFTVFIFIFLITLGISILVGIFFKRGG